MCLQLLEDATAKRVTTANIAVFRAQTPGSFDGPRVWNSQLNRCGSSNIGESAGSTAQASVLMLYHSAVAVGIHNKYHCALQLACMSSAGRAIRGTPVLHSITDGSSAFMFHKHVGLLPTRAIVCIAHDAINVFIVVMRLQVCRLPAGSPRARRQWT